MRAVRSFVLLGVTLSVVACSSLNQGVLDAAQGDSALDVAVDAGGAVDVTSESTATDIAATDAGVDAPVALDVADVPAALDVADVPRIDVTDVPAVPDVTDVPRVDASDCGVGALNCSGTCVADPLSNPNHCGRCGNACVLPNVASSLCYAGTTCVVGACATGFADCDTSPANGCETPVGESLTNCGACGVVCPTRGHSAPRCSGGACQNLCNTGFADCDLMIANGCETSLSLNPNHCGACGTVCGGGRGCAGGTCVAIPTPRALSPLSTSTVTTQAPTLRWVNGPGATGAVLHAADNLAFAREIVIPIVSGSSARLTSLSPGRWYWYLQGVSVSAGNTGAQPSPIWQFTVGARNTPVDRSFGTLSDFNRDGFGDFAAASPTATTDYATVPVSSGRVRLYFGNVAGFAGASVTYQAGGPNTLGTSTSQYGAAVATAGDTNGDGLPELLIAGSDGTYGHVYVYRGAAADDMAPPLAVLSGGIRAAEFGRSVSSAGDVNGDGYADVIVGAANEAYLFPGSATGVRNAPSAVLTGLAGEDYGRAVSGAGDVNGDGFADVLVGAPAFGGNAGRFYLYLGSAGGILAAPAATVSGAGRFGWSLACAGDVNADGYSDVIIGAPDNANRGSTFVYLGSASSLVTSTSITHSMGANLGQFGFAVAGVGDVDRDGYSDVVVGAPGPPISSGTAYLLSSLNYPTLQAPTIPLDPSAMAPGIGGRFGAAVSGIGDSNGDGYMDFLVGAPCAPTTPNCGAGLVYYFRGAADPRPGSFGVFATTPDGGRPGFGSALSQRAPWPPSSRVRLGK
ncbi:MAG: FG-GAP-like repeat-containing protein [Myxococcales bacterium]|nr:FG-GAP-like repeat-containing protein [Myxococcales bacterium]